MFLNKNQYKWFIFPGCFDFRRGPSYVGWIITKFTITKHRGFCYVTYFRMKPCKTTASTMKVICLLFLLPILASQSTWRAWASSRTNPVSFVFGLPKAKQRSPGGNCLSEANTLSPTPFFDCSYFYFERLHATVSVACIYSIWWTVGHHSSRKTFKKTHNFQDIFQM